METAEDQTGDRARPQQVGSTDGTIYTGCGAVRIRGSATTVGKLMVDGAGTEHSTVKPCSHTIYNQEDPAATTTTSKEGKTNNKRRKQKAKRKRKETDKISGTSSAVEDAGLAPADVKKQCGRIFVSSKFPFFLSKSLLKR